MGLRSFSGIVFKTSLSVFGLIEYLRVTMLRYSLTVCLIYNPSRVASNCVPFYGMFYSMKGINL